MTPEQEALAQRVNDLSDDAVADDQQEAARILSYLYICMQNPETLAYFDKAVQIAYTAAIADSETRTVPFDLYGDGSDLNFTTFE